MLGTGLAAVLGGDGRHRGRCEVVSARAVLRLAVPRGAAPWPPPAIAPPVLVVVPLATPDGEWLVDSTVEPSCTSAPRSGGTVSVRPTANARTPRTSTGRSQPTSFRGPPPAACRGSPPPPPPPSRRRKRPAAAAARRPVTVPRRNSATRAPAAPS
ncbi:MAG: hypothetical protein JOY82_09435 [Streptosporangiaceae bacterium]|nr:hypothetical protein [Streptosporangiaceae bacterium]